MKNSNGTAAPAPMRSAHSVAIAITLAAALCFIGNGVFAAEQKRVVTIGGTGCALGGIKLVAAAFQKQHPGLVITIVPSLGSGGGIKAVLAGATDLALSSRPLSADEQAQGAQALAYARTPSLFATSGKPEPLSLTLKEAAAIYAGKTRQWPDGTELRLVLRPDTDSDTALLKKMSPDMEQAVTQAQSRYGLLSAVTDQENADLLSNLTGAFGVITLAQILSENRPLKPVVLDNVAPSLANLASGAYPFSKTFSIVTGPRSSVQAKQFLNYLFSPAGRKILGRYGHLTLEKER